MTRHTSITADKEPTHGRAAALKNKETKDKKRLDKELDKALEDSFPASDPPASSQPTSTEPAGDPHNKP